MKKYKKYGGKLLQIRLTEEELKDINDFIKKFKVTKREWLLAVRNELREKNVLRENRFWQSDMAFAHANNDRYDKKITEDSVCEECGAGQCKWEERMQKQLERHHYMGYKGENAFKVQILCRPCHNKKPKTKVS